MSSGDRGQQREDSQSKTQICGFLNLIQLKKQVKFSVDGSRV